MSDALFPLAVCSELVFLDLPIEDRARRLDELGYLVEIWNWSRHDLPELAKIKYQGVTGAIGFDRYGDLANPAVTLYTYRGGRKTRIDILH